MTLDSPLELLEALQREERVRSHYIGTLYHIVGGVQAGFEAHQKGRDKEGRGHKSAICALEISEKWKSRQN